MKHTPRSSSTLQRSLLLVIIIIVSFFSWWTWDKTRTDDQPAATANSQVSYTGTIESMDLSPMAVDGSGVFIIKAADQRVTVHLTSGESLCDRAAITVPDVRVGDTVRIKGERGSDGIIRICQQGTYIKP